MIAATLANENRPLPGMKMGGSARQRTDSVHSVAQKVEFHNKKSPHLVTCTRCRLAYRETHYHCCVCRYVYRSASAYERHAKISETSRRPATPTQLVRIGLQLAPDGVWMRTGTLGNATRDAKASPAGYASLRAAHAAPREGGPQ
jgi:hypothetical protein